MRYLVLSHSMTSGSQGENCDQSHDLEFCHGSYLIIQVRYLSSGFRTIPMARSQISTRERLIDSARFLFWERGFAGTSMSELLAHAEVNSGSFYHFFDSKEALLRAVLEGYLQLLRPMIIDPAFASVDEPLGRIFAILAGYRERIVGTDCRYGCPLSRLALEIDPENAPAHGLIAENFRGWIGAVKECLVAMKPA